MLFSLILACMFFFSQFRPPGICPLSFHKICVHIHVNAPVSETVLWGTITWSEIRKQKIHAKKVYSIWNGIQITTMWICYL